MSDPQQFVVYPSQAIRGTVRVPGDKSISHRSVMLGALAQGTTQVKGFLQGADAMATLRAFQAMGVPISEPNDGVLTIQGVGLHGLSAPTHALDMGNSGTAMRLMAGILAGQPFASTLTGDASLSKRPMQRVTAPLAQMGAQVETQTQGTPPLSISPAAELKGIDYTLPMASAQVKSCLMFAGLYAQGQTCITEPAPTRDHPARMFRGFGLDVATERLDEQRTRVCLSGGAQLTATQIDVPTDISSAAFFMVAALITPDSDLLIEHVGINPTRTGVIDILKRMGADLTLENQTEVGGEPVADIRVRSSQLRGIEIPKQTVPLAIDEFPVIFVAASAAQGTTVLTGAEELRVKESDRIQVMADGLQALGIKAIPTPDGMEITGGPQETQRAPIASHHDHRISMAMAVAGLRAPAPICIDDCANVNTSFPSFVALMQQVGLSIEVRSTLSCE